MPANGIALAAGKATGAKPELHVVAKVGGFSPEQQASVKELTSMAETGRLKLSVAQGALDKLIAQERFAVKSHGDRAALESKINKLEALIGRANWASEPTKTAARFLSGGRIRQAFRGADALIKAL